MKTLKPSKIKKYGSFLAVTLGKKSVPGDGDHGNGVKKDR